MRRLGLCLLGVTVLGLVATATTTLAENWKPSPGEAKTFYDADFMRVDETSGLVVVRIAEGRPNGPYKAWPASKGPIRVASQSTSPSSKAVNEAKISTADSRTQIWVMPTNEELIVARQTKQHLQGEG